MKFILVVLIALTLLVLFAVVVAAAVIAMAMTVVGWLMVLGMSSRPQRALMRVLGITTPVRTTYAGFSRHSK